MAPAAALLLTILLGALVNNVSAYLCYDIATIGAFGQSFTPLGSVGGTCGTKGDSSSRCAVCYGPNAPLSPMMQVSACATTGLVWGAINSKAGVSNLCALLDTFTLSISPGDFLPQLAILGSISVSCTCSSGDKSNHAAKSTPSVLASLVAVSIPVIFYRKHF